MSLDAAERSKAFGETRDRKVAAGDPAKPTKSRTGIAELAEDAPPPGILQYGYRPMDRRFAFYDDRVGGFIRRSLHQTLSNDQVFFSTLMTKRLGAGPAVTATAYLPDMDFFCNRGAADILPLYKDEAAAAPNLTTGLIEALAVELGKVSPEDVFAYLSCVLGSPAYVELFAEDLKSPGPRIPITKDPARFVRAAALGRRFVWLQTLGQRWAPSGEKRGVLPHGGVSEVKPISGAGTAYPASFSYDADKQQLTVGEGVIGGVSPAVYNYEQSKWKVVQGWLSYRMKAGAGRATNESDSGLDSLRPTNWTFTAELLDVLRAVQGCVELWPAMEELLVEVAAGDTFAAADLPLPTQTDAKLAADVSNSGVLF